VAQWLRTVTEIIDSVWKGVWLLLLHCLRKSHLNVFAYQQWHSVHRHLFLWPVSVSWYKNVESFWVLLQKDMIQVLVMTNRTENQ